MSPSRRFVAVADDNPDPAPIHVIDTEDPSARTIDRWRRDSLTQPVGANRWGQRGACSRAMVLSLPGDPMTRNSLALIPLLLIGLSSRDALALDVLLIYDTTGYYTADMVAAIEAAGHTVTYSDTDENSYDGTNPSTDGFDVVWHMNGTTWGSEMPTGGQSALVAFVEGGGGFVHQEWNAYETDSAGYLSTMEDLTLLERDSGGTRPTPIASRPVPTTTRSWTASPTGSRSTGPTTSATRAPSAKTRSTS